jgi:hypothetical protein
MELRRLVVHRRACCLCRPWPQDCLLGQDFNTYICSALHPRHNMARQCRLLPPVLVLVQASVGACCDSCKATANCNAWTFCSQKGGCRMPDGKVFKVRRRVARVPVLNLNVNNAL